MLITGIIAFTMFSAGEMSVKPELIYDFETIRLKSSIETYIEKYNPEVFGFKPDKVIYRISADIQMHDINIEIGERCDHELDKFKYSDIVNSHYIKIERYNKN